MSSEVETINSSVVTTTNSTQAVSANKIVIKLSRVSSQIDENSMRVIDEDNVVKNPDDENEDDQSYEDDDEEDIVDIDDDINEMQIETINNQSNRFLNDDKIDHSEILNSSHDLIQVNKFKNIYFIYLNLIFYAINYLTFPCMYFIDVWSICTKKNMDFNLSVLDIIAREKIFNELRSKFNLILIHF